MRLSVSESFFISQHCINNFGCDYWFYSLLSMVLAYHSGSQSEINKTYSITHPPNIKLFAIQNKLGWAGAQSRLKQLAWSLVQGKAKSYLFTSWNLNVFKFSFNKHSISLWIIPISTSWDWVVPSSVKADSK